VELRKIARNHYETIIFLFTLSVMSLFVGLQWPTARFIIFWILLFLPFSPVCLIVYLYIKDDPNWKNFPYHGLLPLFAVLALFLKFSTVIRTA
jgi:hypothetical protein